MCVISDQKGVLGLGGIIGGITTSTELNTKNILLEAAYFSPSSIKIHETIFFSSHLHLVTVKIISINANIETGYHIFCRVGI
mgnify:CR=1 FL=1